MYFRLREEEHRALGLHSDREPVQFSDTEGGYVATLDVFHELHCLNLVRKHIRWEQYVTPEGRKPSTVEMGHTDHCLNVLREILMCKADISVLSYEWHSDDRHPLANFHMDRECRNWDKIVEWTKKPGRYIKTLKGPVLTHPTLGISILSSTYCHYYSIFANQSSCCGRCLVAVG
jgi:hypothetical protein